MGNNYSLSNQRGETTPLIDDHYDSSSIELNTVCYPQPNERRLKRRWRDTYPLPPVVQVTLGLLGLWSPLRRTKSPTTIQQHSINLEEILTYNDEREDSDESSSQEYVDKHGNKNNYSHDSDDDVGDRSTKARARDRKRKYRFQRQKYVGRLRNCMECFTVLH